MAHDKMYGDNQLPTYPEVGTTTGDTKHQQPTGDQRAPMTSHTPGPWCALHAKVGRYHIAAQDGGPTRLYLVAETASDSETERANAHLMAAAPDMLRLLNAVAEHFDGTDAPLGQLARTVIARAEGR